VDATKARQQLREWNEQLSRLDEEREVLLSLVRGFEGWLRLHGDVALHAPVKAAPSIERPRTRRRTAPRPATSLKGSISLRKAVLQVLREAHGEPVHVREILARIEALGAVTEAKNPLKIIDLIASGAKTRNHEPIERVSPRSWRWAGTTNTSAKMTVSRSSGA